MSATSGWQRGWRRNPSVEAVRVDRRPDGKHDASTIGAMAEIPPPPDELPDGFSLEGDEKADSWKDHYRRLKALTEEIRQANQELLENRKALLRDLKRVEKIFASPGRVVILGALGAIIGMAAYHISSVVVTVLLE